ncbi:MAG: hypothetical protein KDD67_04110 [Ignavibacteriae bacterium]|nr:hypothetical protein [Ignavibacteriota bacterium]
MRRSVLLSLIIAGFLLFGGVASVNAQQTLFGLGPKIGLYLDDPVFLIGGVVELPVTREWIFEPGVELVFEQNSTTRIVGDANVRYAFQIRGEDFSPYLLGGAGLALDISSRGGETQTQTDFRLNVGGGVTLNTRSSTQYWGGLKIFFLSEDDSDISLQGGILFYL